jgi:hypothetical protein
MLARIKFIIKAWGSHKRNHQLADISFQLSPEERQKFTKEGMQPFQAMDICRRKVLKQIDKLINLIESQSNRHKTNSTISYKLFNTFKEKRLHISEMNEAQTIMKKSLSLTLILHWKV